MESWEANDYARQEAVSYFDLAATYTFTDKLRLSAGVNNLLDKDPPLAPSQSSTGWLGTYDPLGRTLYTYLSFEF